MDRPYSDGKSQQQPDFSHSKSLGKLQSNELETPGKGMAIIREYKNGKAVFTRMTPSASEANGVTSSEKRR